MAKQANEGARFASASKEDIATLLSNKDSVNTKRATKAAVTVFEFYILLEKGKCTDFLSLPVDELNDLLKKFYLEARRKDKSLYTKSSLTSVRFGSTYTRFIAPSVE